MCPENTSRPLSGYKKRNLKTVNNTENQHEQTELQKRISSLDVPRDRSHGQREIEEVRVVQEKDIRVAQEKPGRGIGIAPLKSSIVIGARTAEVSGTLRKPQVTL